ncbi:MAG: neutral/alkaline non-lysosomal ceramidase N-terminal domain-containing protein, partial [Candidatus Helarchaeota archaeon]
MPEQSAVGFAEIVITPREDSVPLGGYMIRYSTGVHDDIFARAWYFSNGEKEAFIIATDLVSLYLSFVNRMRRAIHRMTGVKPENILICALHNHSGPDTLGLLGLKGFTKPTLKVKWFERMQKQIVQSAIQAKKNARPGKVGIWQGPVNERLAINRRHPLRSHDYKLSILRVDDLQGSIQGVISNWGCHETTLNPSNLQITAEYSGYLIRKIQKEHPGVFAMYLNGPCGDINPNLFPQDISYEEIDFDFYLSGSYANFNALANYGHTKRIGEKLGEMILGVLDEIQTERIKKIQIMTEKLVIPVTYTHPKIPMTERLVILIKKVLFNFLRFYNRSNLSFFSYQRHERALTIETEVQFIKINDDVLIIGVPVELFSELGNEIIVESPVKHTFIVELANDIVGYVYPPDERDIGGYEVYGIANFSGIL